MFAVRELDVPGEIYERKTFPFEFSSVEMPYESYNGINVRLRYICHFVLDSLIFFFVQVHLAFVMLSLCQSI